MAAPRTSVPGDSVLLVSALSLASSLAWILPALGLFAGFAAAQDNAEMTTKEQPAVFRSSSNLVLVPVVVRDSHGKIVTTLRREDFRLTDSGKTQEITKFSVENRAAAVKPLAAASAGAAPADERPRSIFDEAPVTDIADRFVIYLFDDLHMATTDFLATRQAAERHLAAELRPSDRVAVFTTSGRELQEFTGDRPTLLKAIGRIIPRPMEDHHDCDETTYYIADRYRNMHDDQADRLLTLQEQACHPDADEEEIKVLKEAAVIKALSTGEYEARMPLIALSDAVRRLISSPGQRAIVLVSSGFVSRQLSVEKMDLMERAVKAGVTISAVDSRGLPTYAPTAEERSQIGGAEAQSLRLLLDRNEATEHGDVLAEVAYGTGGVWAHDSNDLVSGFRAAASPAECVYVLGFIPQNLKYDGRFHALKVAVNGGFSVQARRGYYAPTRLMNAEEQAKEEIREAVFSRDEVSDIPLDIRTQFFKPNDISATISVTARIDAQQLHYRKADGRNNESLTVVAVVFDRNGKWISGNEKTVVLRLRDETLASQFAAGLSVRSSFNLTPGLYQIRVVIRDSEGQLMAARNAAVDIP